MAFRLTRTSYDALKAKRDTYLTGTTAPLDGMWENAFFPAAAHWRIDFAEQAIGYCAVNEQNQFLGFDVADHSLRADAFTHCRRTLEIVGAYVSTAEPTYLSQCLDDQTSLTVSALMYQDSGVAAKAAIFPKGIGLKPVQHDELDTAIAFAIDAIGADRNWLTGYYSERILAGELFGLWKGSALMAAGELRLSPNQKAVADVGMIVGTAQRKRGLATAILQQLRYDGQQRGLNLICSTESSNIGAQKAIARAGFISNQRLLYLEF